MKTLLLLITLFAFLQSAFLPINLVLVLLVAKGLVSDDRENLFLAFFGGVVLSFLAQINLGYYPLVFIIVVKLAGLLRKLPVSFGVLPVFLSGGLLISLVGVFNSILIGQNLTFVRLLIEVILVLPAYFLIRTWEGRFVAKSQHIKLKV